MHRVELVVDPTVDIYHLSMINTGLVALSDQRKIDLDYRRPRGAAEAGLVTDPLVVNLLIHMENCPRPCHAAIDLRDKSDSFADPVLQSCDLYFKRSFHQPDVDRLTPDLREKVATFGLNFACKSRRSTFRMLRALAPQIAATGVSGLKKLRHFMALAELADYEQDAESLVDATVVFQTRVWEASETAPGEAEVINRSRVELIRALRRAFGHRFRGGLMPTSMALARFRDEVSPYPARRKEYTAMSKKNLIGVYTRGLFESTAFKLPEYLAAAQCIVAEEPRNGLPTPLLAGKNYLPFRSPDECVAACESLLADRALARSMRHANRAYYLTEVEPNACVSRIIQQATASLPGVIPPSRPRSIREKVLSK